jgi:predicted Zn-dependent protease
MPEEGRFVCETLRRAVERIVHTCPTYVPGLMASAILAYEDRQFALAQQYLDALFSLQRAHGPAAVLRGRIALEEGNVPFAVRFLAEQVTLSPEDAELREVYAGALFVADRVVEARQQLTIASRLGAPAWRVAYHRGLFEELSGNLHLALRHYEEAIQLRPGWEVALARRDGILATTRSQGGGGSPPDTEKPQ